MDGVGGGALPSPGAASGSCKPPPTSKCQSREATYFAVAHDQSAEEQARPRDPHGGEAGAPGSGCAGRRSQGRRGGGRCAGRVPAAQGGAPKASPPGDSGAQHRSDPHPQGPAQGAQPGGGRGEGQPRERGAHPPGATGAPALTCGAGRAGRAQVDAELLAGSGLRTPRCEPARSADRILRPAQALAPPRPGPAPPFPSPSREPAARALRVSSAVTERQQQRVPAVGPNRVEPMDTEAPTSPGLGPPRAAHTPTQLRRGGHRGTLIPAPGPQVPGSLGRLLSSLSADSGLWSLSLSASERVTSPLKTQTKHW